MNARIRLIALTASLLLSLAACQESAPTKQAEAPPKKEPAGGVEKAPPTTPSLEPATPPSTDKVVEPTPTAPPAGEGSDDGSPKTGRDEQPVAANEEPVPSPPSEPLVAEPSDQDAPAVATTAGPKEDRKEEAAKAKALVASKTIVGTLGTEFGGSDGFAAGLSAGSARVRSTGDLSLGIIGGPGAPPPPKEVPGTEDYEKVAENEFKGALENPLSTFSIDVDTASYTNARRFIDTMNRLPPADAVRVEEFINYFSYSYPTPDGDVPFSVSTEVSHCPWNSENRMVLVGIQGKKPPQEELPPSNLVFLIDSSGSMRGNYKMPLLKKGFEMLVRQLSEKDRVAIVVYAGSAGLVLPSTPGTDKGAILGSLRKLRAGGSTAGAAGIQLAYQVAKENFIKGGNNRVILATDGDFNVGAASNSELERMIEEKREDGIFLTVLGFGMGNYKDSRMETLADKGNGNYGYIDNILEAKKVFVTQMTGTLFTIAKDVKIQVEFNPAKVKSYRLVGYENRVMAKEDFADDTKDAGELGAGHTVTALYEIVPALDAAPGKEELKYVKTEVKPGAATSSELMTVKLRFKLPDGDVSSKIEHPVLDQGVALEKTSDNFRFAASVAMFGMLLKNSYFVGNTTYGKVIEQARGARGDDSFGYRAEFIKIVEKADLLAPSKD